MRRRPRCGCTNRLVLAGGAKRKRFESHAGFSPAARPKAIGALLRYFRDLDRAEEAFQEACLRALKNWPLNGPPRDPTAWLILVGRNSALDDVRRSSKSEPLPADEAISDLGDAESDIAERLDN